MQEDNDENSYRGRGLVQLGRYALSNLSFRASSLKTRLLALLIRKTCLQYPFPSLCPVL